MCNAYTCYARKPETQTENSVGLFSCIINEKIVPQGGTSNFNIDPRWLWRIARSIETLTNGSFGEYSVKWLYVILARGKKNSKAISSPSFLISRSTEVNGIYRRRRSNLRYTGVIERLMEIKKKKDRCEMSRMQPREVRKGGERRSSISAICMGSIARYRHTGIQIRIFPVLRRQS